MGPERGSKEEEARKVREGQKKSAERKRQEGQRTRGRPEGDKNETETQYMGYLGSSCATSERWGLGRAPWLPQSRSLPGACTSVCAHLVPQVSW